MVLSLSIASKKQKRFSKKASLSARLARSLLISPEL
jgi:hypothetical protein